MNSLFEGCEMLKTIKFSENFNTDRVYNMERMFFGCKNLNDLDISMFNVERVYNMRQMFKDCSKLSSIDLTRFRTTSVDNMVEMFSGCTSLRTIQLMPYYFVSDQVASFEKMFYNCKRLIIL
jgi:surface protein